ncbi:MAG: DUF835 domain-containing protein [Thermoplasmata archaeon]
MAVLSERPDPKVIEPEARAIWKARRLPPAQGPLGPGEGPTVHQFEGSFAPQEAGMLLVQRAIAADVDARALMLSGRRALGILRKEEGGPAISTPRVDSVLAALGIWVGGPDGRGWDNAPRRTEVQTLVGRLAHLGALAVRDVSLRICPACAVARDPERIVYQEEHGETLLVRFAFTAGDRTISALVWTDAAWRLLGTSALMVHPDLPYVVARCRRHGTEEFVFTSKSSLARIRDWLPGVDLEVLEEHPGRHWEGTPYIHPLRHEFPMGGSMSPPGGTILPVPDVGDSSTGVVPLVPGHGGTDAQIAERLGVPGWPLITPKGRFDVTLVHKYAGLELESGSEFVVRDLLEDGAIFAQLRVRRGVPHCSRCGTALIWAPGRAWCLEPSQLPDEKIAVYRSLLPRDRPIEKLEAVPWPISEPMKSGDPLAVSLLECTSCDRLEALGKEAERCVCGGRRRPVRRRLLSAFDAAAAAWAEVDPFPPADTARLYVNERRRAPAVVHYIAAMSGVGGTVGEVRLTVLPTVPEADLPGLLETYGADAVRAAIVRVQSSEGATATLPLRCAQERHRLDRFWEIVRDTLGRIDGPSVSSYGQPIAGSFGDLEPEDRALLARFEAVRIQCWADYDRAAPAYVHRRLFRFLENDLARYRSWTAGRLAAPGSPPSKQSALRTLVHVISSSILLLGPIAPHLAEATHRALRRARASLFEETAAGVDRTLLDDTRAKAWDRWTAVTRAADRFRRTLGVPVATVLPSMALVVGSDPLGDELRAEAPTLERLAGVQKIEVGSPAAPWAGRRRQLRPVEAEIQRIYPARAAQIIHMLRRMPERKWADPSSGQEFSMMVNGQPTHILPSMIAWAETLPDRLVPVPWSPGELYAEVPAGRDLPSDPPPPLSPDGFGVVTRVAHRIRSAPGAVPPVVIVAAPGPLGAELGAVAVPLARHLGVPEFRVVASDRELPRHGLEYGRTKAGTPWSFHVGRAPTVARPVKSRPARERGARVRPAFAPGALTPEEKDYADEGLIAREAAVRALGEELDDLLGAPVLGPTKVAAAWELGLTSVEEYRRAPWITLVGAPGFGVPIASALVRKFGGTVPAQPPRVRPSPSRLVGANNGHPEPPHWVEPPTAPVVPPAVARTAGAPPARTALLARLPPSETGAIAPRPLSSPARLVGPAVPTLPAPVGAPPSDPVPEEATEPRTEESAARSEGPPPPEMAPTLTADAGDAETAPIPDAPFLGEVETPELLPLPEEDTTPEPVEPLQADPDASEPPNGEPATPETDAPPVDDSPAIEPPLPVAAEMELPVESPTEPSPATEGFPGAEVPPAGSAFPPEVVEGPPSDSVAASTTSPDSTSRAVAPPPVNEPYDDVAASPRAGESAAPPAEAVLLPEPMAEVVDDPAETPAEAGPAQPSAGVPDPEPGTNPSIPEPASEPPALTEAEPVDAAATLPSSVPGDSSAPRVPELALPSPVPDLAPPPTASPAAPVFVPEVIAPVTAAPPSGGVEVVVGTSYVPTLERFLEATAAGHQGICVVRDSPERVRAYVGSRPVEIRWLTNIGRGPTLKPTDLEGFSAFLSHAVSTGRVTAFFLEGVEYLVRLHGLERVVERMTAFDRLARAQSARVWLPLNPKLLSAAELERLVSAFASPPASG